MDDAMNISAGQKNLKNTFDATASRMLKVDVERYQSYLDDMDMTQAQKEEFLEAVWLIVVGFVELGFEVHPLQEVCGKVDQNGTQRAVGAFDRVSSEHPNKNKGVDDVQP